MKNKSTEELLNMLTEVCIELQGRTVGLADINGCVEPIVEVSGGCMMTLHIGSMLGVQTMRASMDQFKTRMFDGNLRQEMDNYEALKTHVKLLLDGKKS